MRLSLASILVVALAPSVARADEGLWRPDQLVTLAPAIAARHPGVDASGMGSLTDGPLASVVRLGTGCSGAFVSDTGLVATAYHCVWDALRYASHDSENLVESGFSAASSGGERWAGPAMTVQQTLSSDDVTAQVLEGTSTLTGTARTERVSKNSRALVARCELEGGITCEVQPFDGGTQHRLLRIREWRDARLVYAPPRSVGFFGGRDDNWSWPRQAGDFAFLRVYTDASGAPAAHADTNVPYKPAHHLVAAQGPKTNDFVMVAGYPAETRRWIPAAEFAFTAGARLHEQARMTQELTDALADVSAHHPDLGAKVATPLFELDNRLLYLRGNETQLAALDAVGRKWKVDADLEQWVAADAGRQAKWGAVFDQMRSLAAGQSATAERDVVVSYLFRRPLLLKTALALYTNAAESRKRDAARLTGYQERDRADLVASLDGVDARFDPALDAPVLRLLLRRALTLPTDQRVPEIDRWFGGLPLTGTLDERLDAEIALLYASNSALRDPAARRALVDATPFRLESTDDPWLALAAYLQPAAARQEASTAALDSAWSVARASYVEALKAWKAVDDAPFYPDGNGTLRVSFGVVDGYSPEDGAWAEPHTTLRGMAAKAGPAPFDLPPGVLAKLGADASVGVDFLSTADTTSGNSGSPTYTTDGRWVGILFDGNAESMATDWLYEEAITRSIHTDASFVLWYLDAVAGERALLDELGQGAR